MNTNIKRKTVVVTGASAGLGRAIVREFTKYGANIGLLARGTEGLEGARKEVEQHGLKALAVPVDVSKPEELEKAATKIEEEIGPIDIWVNNAMVSVFGPFVKIKPEEYKRVTEVTYLGQVYGTQVALTKMRPRNKGTIILIGSALAYRGIPLQTAYCGAKHGIHGFFESLRSELIHNKSKIHLGMVQMPAMNTTQFGWVKSYLTNKPRPMGLIYQPVVGARAVIEMAQRHVRELYIGYPTVKAIQGNKIVPGYIDYRLAKTGFSGQQTDERDSKDRPNNLWEPIPGDAGAHGRFNEKSWTICPQAFLSKYKTEIAVGAAAALATAIGIRIGRKRK